jgi:hypothetical protein
LRGVWWNIPLFTTIYHYLPLFSTWKQSQNKDFAQQSIGFRPLKTSF